MSADIDAGGQALVGPSATSRAARSALLRAVALLYLTRLLWALLASYPVVASVGASGILEFDAGAGKLFEPGGLYLLEVLLRERAELLALMTPTAVLLIAGALVALVPEWLLLRALAGSVRAELDTSPRRALPRLVALALASWTARALTLALGAALAMTARSYVVSASDERWPLIATAVVVLLGLVAWACLSVLHDLAAIEITLRGQPTLAAIERALGLLRQHAFGLARRYAAWLLATAAVLLGSATAASALDVSSGARLPALASLAMHQLALLAQVALHAVWLGSVVALATPAPERRALERAQADAFL